MGHNRSMLVVIFVLGILKNWHIATHFEKPRPICSKRGLFLFLFSARCSWKTPPKSLTLIVFVLQRKNLAMFGEHVWHRVYTCSTFCLPTTCSTHLLRLRKLVRRNRPSSGRSHRAKQLAHYRKAHVSKIIDWIAADESHRLPSCMYFNGYFHKHCFCLSMFINLNEFSTFLLLGLELSEVTRKQLFIKSALPRWPKWNLRNLFSLLFIYNSIVLQI